MIVGVDEKKTGYGQVHEWWWIRADDWCWWLPMAMRGGLPMVMEKGAGVVDRLMVVYQSIMEDDLMLSVVIGVCFVYGFRLI